MTEISNETLCMIVIVFIIVLILFSMGRDDSIEKRSPCMKIASKFQDPSNEYGLQFGNSPKGIPTGENFKNPITDTTANSANNPFVAGVPPASFTNEYGLNFGNSPKGIPTGENFKNPITDTTANSANNPFVAGVPPTSFNNPLSGNNTNGAGGPFYVGNLAANVNYRIGSKYIYPPDVKNPKYIAEFGIDKGINGVSGLPHDNALPIYGSPMSMRVVPSQTLNKN